MFETRQSCFSSFKMFEGKGDFILGELLRVDTKKNKEIDYIF